MPQRLQDLHGHRDEQPGRRRGGFANRCCTRGSFCVFAYSTPSATTTSVARDQPENAGERAGDAAKAHADGHRQVDHVAARQELAQPEQIGEFVGGEPLALFDDGAPRERQRAAKRHEAKRQETGEQLGEADAAGEAAGGGAAGGEADCMGFLIKR